MENSNHHIVDKLNHLIAIVEDGREGYENAAEDVKDVTIKSSFLAFAHQRSGYATQLRELVHQLNGESEDNNGEVSGLLHRVWMDFKSIFTDGDTDAIINACITGEEAAVKEYKEVLNDSAISNSHKQLISEQLQGIEHTLEKIKSHVHV